ncbi:UvrD-helicase domain-containing protein [Paraflavitalea speifideaquila]|uniref:UvrD-helicase domain-containing protein n=1 Tax=Paraflavitalea speifideaquila TaxID=3076558 RepID=UPI0028E4EE91|nr:UvrD-helicase domain-containing protein [Paraflavitalea speifideiaquila]
MRKKYKAVFIDEFQDTDRQQFEIFNTAFGTGTILFYIGDPKQSIYAWRKADIFTYFKARDAVTHLYGMNHNYRSSERMIAGMNQFFLPEKDFDTFYFEEQENAIDYIAVDSPSPNTKGSLLEAGVEAPPITIFPCLGKTCCWKR